MTHVQNMTAESISGAWKKERHKKVCASAEDTCLSRFFFHNEQLYGFTAATSATIHLLHAIHVPRKGAAINTTSSMQFESPKNTVSTQ